jgi:hypothetical protein
LNDPSPVVVVIDAVQHPATSSQNCDVHAGID